MPVQFLVHDNQDAAYLKAAGAGAAAGYLAKQILPLNIQEQGIIKSKRIIDQARKAGQIARKEEYNIISEEIKKGTLNLSETAQDIFVRNRKEILSGNISDVLKGQDITKETQKSIQGISRRIADKGAEGYKIFMNSAETITKGARSSVLYVLFGILTALSAVTIAHSAKTVSDITDKNARFSVKI